MSKKRDRTLRREAVRDAGKLAEAREKLARLEPGGSAECPIRVESASQVELRVESLRCPRCDGELRVHEHAARMVAGHPRRVVDARCKRCGRSREVWLTIDPAHLH